MLFYLICKINSEMMKVSRGKVIVEARVGGKYEILEGFISGEF